MNKSAEYKREMNRNYMVLRPHPDINCRYIVRMLDGNSIQGLLPFQEKIVNGQVSYYYDITSRQPLGRILEVRHIAAGEIRCLVSDLILSLRQMERFLLDENQLILEPEYIYVEPDSFRTSFCLYPGEQKDFPSAFRILSQYLLESVNHNDAEAVILAFSLMRESREETFGIEDLERALEVREETGGSDLPETYQEKAVRGDAISKKTKGQLIGEWNTDEEKTKQHYPEKNSKEKISESTPPKVKQPRQAWKILLPLGIFVPALIYILGGSQTLFRYKWIILAIEGILLLGSGLLSKISVDKERLLASNDKEGIHKEKDSEEEWTVFFREGGEEPPDSTVGSVSNISVVGSPESHYSMDHFLGNDEVQTILLQQSAPDPACHKLTPINGGPEIQIPYCPFIIGKNKDLVDFCLAEPEVSRLHLRIDESGSGYTITDLNSTNGTCVDGYLLDANETYPILPGSEVIIGTKKYHFL